MQSFMIGTSPRKTRVLGLFSNQYVHAIGGSNVPSRYNTTANRVVSHKGTINYRKRMDRLCSLIIIDSKCSDKVPSCD